MTYPVPGEFPDFEQVLIDLLTPIAYTCSTLPASEQDFQDALPLIWARRIDGGIDADQITDTAIVQLDVFAHKRSDAQALGRRATAAVLGCGGTRVNGVLIDWVEQNSGGAGGLDTQDIDPLNRVAQAQFRIDARRQFP
ncbi:hypothetical protein [Nocardia transvalensis]|uniref:phage tail termination protein n=1 Tax=Nocardia transvalensis TaxID=37333 RepID=UPI001893DC3D|nr:hypothetical protein [Nocardia transvalensis]MBF6332376.1 hypothetical protein [Nocardia transvalensis]